MPKYPEKTGILSKKNGVRLARKIEVYTLTQNGFDAKGFGDGISMLEALKTEKPELIVHDIMLPGKDGAFRCDGNGISY